MIKTKKSFLSIILCNFLLFTFLFFVPESKSESLENLYKIEEKSITPCKIGFTIGIKRKLTKEEIENITKKTREDYKNYWSTECTSYINFYLPGISRNDKASAITSWDSDSDLFVNILYSTPEQEKKLKNLLLPKGKILGKWIQEDGEFTNSKIIYSVNGKYKLREIYLDKSFGDRDLVKKGNIYIYENDHGEYIKIENNGDFNYYNNDGKIRSKVMKKFK